MIVKTEAGMVSRWLQAGRRSGNRLTMTKEERMSFSKELPCHWREDLRPGFRVKSTTVQHFLPAYQVSGAKGRKRLGYKRSTEGQKRIGKPIMPEDIANFEAAILFKFVSKVAFATY